MGSFGFTDYILNVCRSFTDVLHILLHVIFVVAILIYSWKKYDQESYTEYFSAPLRNQALKLIARFRFWMLKRFIERLYGIKIDIDLTSNRKTYSNQNEVKHKRRRSNKDK